MIGHDVVAAAGLAAEEVLEGYPRVVHDPELLGEPRLSDHPGAGRGERRETADVIPVGVRKDDVGDRLGRAPAKGVERCPGGGLGGAGIDGHDAVPGDHEREIGEVVALGDVDPRRDLQQPRRPEPEAVPSGHREVRGELGHHGVQ